MPNASPWSIIPIEKWQNLLAAVLDDSDFDTDAAALDAGLDEEQTVALWAWRDHVEMEAAVKLARGEMAESTIRFMESLLPDLGPDERTSAEREIEAIKKRQQR